jgi:two-component system, cell cycle sensor histidine kinase and response regulator CckA
MLTGPGLRVLLVEDDEAFASFLGLALARSAQSVAVHAVSDLTAALEQVALTRPDAVILDLNLPDSNGLATLRAVLAAAPEMPVVVLTGVDDVDVAGQALQLGAQDWLLKGQLDPELVQRAVRYAVERKHLTERLVQAQKLEIAGRLANGVAHEFNNVLTAVAGSAQLVEEAEDAEARASALDLLRRAARQGIALSRQLLSLARNPPINAAVVSTAALMDSGRPLVQAVLPSSVLLEIGPVADVPVRLDPGQFDQLLLNLVLNARDAMPQGGTLRISVTAEPAHGHEAAVESEWASRNPLYAVVRVSDTGIGIDPSIRGRLFEPFFTTKGARGTGLGLAVVAEIVDRFGGAIHVDSWPGEGTTFAVSVPAAAEPAEEEHRA